MKRFNIPLAIGVAGLLAMQVACHDSPTIPDNRGAPERVTDYVDLIVRNLLDTQVDVWVDIAQERTQFGIVRGGTIESGRMTVPTLAGGPARFVAMAVTEGGEIRSEPLDIMPGWTVEVTVGATGPVARHRPDCDGGGGRCVR